jgi:hypothetical protein
MELMPQAGELLTQTAGNLVEVAPRLGSHPLGKVDHRLIHWGSSHSNGSNGIGT